MSTKRTAATKVAPSISPDPGPQDGGGVAPADLPADDAEDAPPAPSPAPPAPAPMAGGTTPDAAPIGDPHLIPVAPGSSGFYTGARPVESKAAYDARLGAHANTFGDLGWILGTKPKA